MISNNTGIPDEAWANVVPSQLRNGVLYPCLKRTPNPTVEQISAMKHFTCANYDVWVGACAIEFGGPGFEFITFHFDVVTEFIANGYRNPTRLRGKPDWYFFDTSVYKERVIRRFARSEGLLGWVGVARDDFGGGYGRRSGLKGRPVGRTIELKWGRNK